MEQLFSRLAVIAAAMILAAGSSVYWLSAAKVAQAKQDSVAVVAKAVVLSLSEQIELIGQSLFAKANFPVGIMTFYRRMEN